MTASASATSLLTDAALERRDTNLAFFDREADRIANACQAMAERFIDGGRLLALGATPAMRSDARHVAVEFVHPVIVGKRALPSLALVGGANTIAEQVALLVDPADIVIGFGDDDAVTPALASACERGALTIGCPSPAAAWVFGIPTGDAAIAQEVTETLYHVLWELVHVFLDHRTDTGSSGTGGGKAGFLYPFLAPQTTTPRDLLSDVAASVRMKAAEIADLRDATLARGATTMVDAASALSRRFAEGGTLLVCGNGGSATDAMDVTADFQSGWSSLPSRPAIDLTEDTGILTAIANDVGVESIFRRQVIAWGRRDDALLAITTSGNSANVIAALEEARHRGMLTLALAGYDGGRIAQESLADHVVVVPSEHIPRIQEAQATVYHLLRGMIGDA